MMFIPSYRRYFSVFVLGTLSGCQHAGLAPAATSARSIASAPNAPKPRVAVAQVASATPTPALAAPETSPFVEGIRLGYAARLSVAGKSAFLSTDKLLLGVQDDSVAVDPALLEGLGNAGFPRVLGSMPDGAWVLQLSYAERTTRTSLAHWTGSEWQSADALLNGKNVIGISAWSAGRTLALVDDEYAKQLDFVQLGGSRRVPLPQLDHTAHNAFGCVHGIQPSVMTALPSGEVFLAGMHCTVGPDEEATFHSLVVERWGAGEARGHLVTLPRLADGEGSGELTSIVAASGNDVFVAGTRAPATADGEESKDEAYLAHFDGKGWRALPAPPVERIEELQRAPDGKLWALSGGDLWTTTGSASETATWESVPMPHLAQEAGEHAVSSFWVQDTGGVWATVGSDGFSYLLRTKRGAAPLSAPSDAQVAELSQALDPSAGYDCENPTLVLLTLSRTAPKDADMPSVRAALRGHSELAGKAQFVELPFLTRRYLAARGDAETLQETSDILAQAAIPGVSPELRCLNVAPTRTLRMDFTGPQLKPKARLPKRARTGPSDAVKIYGVPMDPQTAETVEF